MAKLKSNAIPLHEVTEVDYHAGHQDDRDIANHVQSAMIEIQGAMDRAVLAGLIVEPNFARIENRMTQCGARIDSFVCKIGVYRKLT